MIASPSREERSPLAAALSDWASRHGGDSAVAGAMAACIQAVENGDVCFRLDALPENGIDTGELRQTLLASDLVIKADSISDTARPLVIDGDRLYLHRYWHYEERLAAGLRGLLESPPQDVDITPLLPDGEVFDYSWLSEGETHWQAMAAFAALRHRLVVISGGPGTGKTYTVMRLMRLLNEAALEKNDPPPLIRLAAPTGKAAARMVESTREGLAAMTLSQQIRDHIPDDASTLHRLLGVGFGTTQPRHNQDNPLAADVVIVDEASMVDLPTMARLVDALPDHARLILLGDRYQLASVESGAVLAELCDAAGVNVFSAEQQQAAGELLTDETPAGDQAMADHVVTLQTSRRFHADSGIGRLAAAINEGNAAAALEILNEESRELHWIAASGPTALDGLLESITSHATALAGKSDPGKALALLDKQILLCALRLGPTGASTLNQRISSEVRKHFGLPAAQRWYTGRPVIVTRNDYRQGLFNGDIGLCLPTDNGDLRVWFASSDGPRAVLPATLPEHDTAYALTIHRSQGSEFDHVTVVLPDADSPVLSRELLYTGITRARERVTLCASEPVLKAAIARPISRNSGLAERLGRPDHK